MAICDVLCEMRDSISVSSSIAISYERVNICFLGAVLNWLEIKVKQLKTLDK